jgi:hypothetical protein
MANNSDIIVLNGKNQVRVTVNDSFDLIIKNQDIKQAFLKAIASVVARYANEVVKSIVIEIGATKNTIEFNPSRENATIRLSNTIAREFAKAIISTEQADFSPEIKQELIDRLSDRFRKEMSNLVILKENDKTETIVLNDTASDDIPALTPEYLANSITPYINAVIDLQHIIDEIKKRKPSDINIKEIKRNSPISVSLDGAGEAIQIIKETIVPWRRKHAETMARLLEQEKSVEIEAKKAEVLEKRAIAAREREETDKVKLENEKLRAEISLQKAKVQLALDILSIISSNLNQTEREIYIQKLLPIIDTLALGKIELLGRQKAG